MNAFRIPRWIALGCLVLGLGCGSGEGELVVVKGKLTKGGQPFVIDTSKLPPGDFGLQVVFIPETAGQFEEPGVCDSAKGTFEVAGQKGRGIKPGRYKIVIVAGAFGTKDQLGNKFHREKSKCVREVKPGMGDIEIDVSKPEG
jgi:hypothetical protein